MTFDKVYLAVPVFIVCSMIIFFSLRKDRKLSRVVKDNWLMKTNKVFWIRRILYYLGLACLLFSLLDPRGAVINVEGSIPDQKTVMLIDTSSSMFVEDVRPNRYKRAIFLARHFVKKAVGHQISIVLFSDIQKRIVPFTDDLDLLDARLSALENDIGAGGGSNLSQAIEESLQYFKSTTENDGIKSGNLLILTDSEGHDGSLSNDVSDKINVALVGVGTLRGGKVPIRDSRGVFRGYKKFQDKEVESKLNEKWMKSLSSRVKSYKYWIANSYSMPTTEIVDFFRGNFTKSLSKGNVSIKPVLFHKSAVVGIILIVLSYISYPLRSFSTLAVLLSILASTNVKSNEEQAVSKSSEYEEKLRQGDITEEELVYFIEQLLIEKKYEKAAMLYEERLKHLDPMSLNNYGLALVQLKKKKRALDVFRKAEAEIIAKGGNDELLKAVRKNILLLIKKKKEDSKKKKNNKDNKNKDKNEKDKNKNDKNESQKKQGKDKKKSDSDKEDKNSDKQKEKKDSEDKKSSDEKSDEKMKQDQAKEKSQDEKSKDQKKDKVNQKGKDEKEEVEKKGEKKTLQQKLREKENENKLKRKMKKIPGVIKQIMSNDRELQRKHIDTSTKERSNYKKRDW